MLVAVHVLLRYGNLSLAQLLLQPLLVQQTLYNETSQIKRSLSMMASEFTQQADMNRDLVDLEIRDRNGMTALAMAAYVGDESLVCLLISAKANVQTADNAGLQPLHHSAVQGFCNIVQLLLHCTPEHYETDNDQDAVENESYDFPPNRTVTVVQDSEPTISKEGPRAKNKNKIAPITGSQTSFVTTSSALFEEEVLGDEQEVNTPRTTSFESNHPPTFSVSQTGRSSHEQSCHDDSVKRVWLPERGLTQMLDNAPVQGLQTPSSATLACVVGNVGTARTIFEFVLQ